MENTTYYIKFISSSLIVIGILLILLKTSKKIQKNHLTKEIKIIDRLSTGSQAHIFLLNVRGSEYLVGATNQNIQILDKL